MMCSMCELAYVGVFISKYAQIEVLLSSKPSRTTDVSSKIEVNITL